MEHRWGQRKPVQQRVRVLTAGGIAAQGHIANVSISGAFVRTPLPARILSIVRIMFVADSRSHIAATVTAQVVRKTAEGLGLEWCEAVPDIAAGLTTTPASGESLTVTSRAMACDLTATLETVE
jgi:hypothetical protein